MPITVRWDKVMEDVVVYIYPGNWTWEDYEAASAQMRELIALRDGRIDLIVDLLPKTLMLPPNFGARMREIMARTPAQIGLIVVTGPEVIRDILNVLVGQRQAFSRRFVFALTLAEARRLIRDSRGSGGQSNGSPADGDE